MSNAMPVAIVTGAGRRAGIGRAIAQRAARDGFAVVVHERSTSSVTESELADGWSGAASVVDEIMAAGGSAIAVSGDVLDRATAADLVAAAAQLGALSAVINNHGNAGEANAHMVHTAPDDVLAAELQRRGWVVMEP